jgi:hypothetical protein
MNKGDFVELGIAITILAIVASIAYVHGVAAGKKIQYEIDKNYQNTIVIPFTITPSEENKVY